MMEDILKPEYIAFIIKEREKLKKEKAQTIEIPRGESYEIEATVEYFVDSTFERFIYIARSEDSILVARSSEKINTKGEKKFLVKDKKGLKRLLLSEISKSKKVGTKGINFILATIIGVLLSYMANLQEYVILIAAIFGIMGKFLEDIASYYLIGYCES